MDIFHSKSFKSWKLKNNEKFKTSTFDQNLKYFSGRKNPSFDVFHRPRQLFSFERFLKLEGSSFAGGGKASFAKNTKVLVNVKKSPNDSISKICKHYLGN